jgi:PelA/Pel-15E family pectate lyase
VLLGLALCVAASIASAGGGAVRWADVLKQADAWYGTADARAIADAVLSYQEGSGGWPKNIDMTVPRPPRAAADRPEATIDNQATFTQIRYLGRVYRATRLERDRDAALRGIDYLLRAQYANGGWPQFFPLRDDYSRHITFNDGAMIGVMTLLDDIVGEPAAWAWVDEARRGRARDAVARGVDVILRAQVKVEGALTVWCAQHDEVTLAPRPARAYEHVSLSGNESVGIVRFLMDRAQARPASDAAIEAAVAWFGRVKITGVRLDRIAAPALPGGVDRILVRDERAPALWARFYEPGTNRPIYSGRDGIVRYDLAEIEHERRMGYEWIGDWPRRLLERDYPRWVARRARR